MKKYTVVWANSAKSYLCKWYGDHYEIEAEGQHEPLMRLAKALNDEPTEDMGQ